MSYLVTGGTGYIGSYIVRDLLNQDKEVVCLQRSGVTPIFRNVVGDDNINKAKIVQGDISNSIQLFNLIKANKIDKVIHASSLLTLGDASEANPSYTLQVNCVGMNNLLEAARLFGFKRIVWTSSLQALGEIVKYHKEPISDDAIYKPNSMYSATKVLDEFMAKLYYDKFGVDSIGFRIGLILGVDKPIGPGGIITNFIKSAATDAPTTIKTVKADAARTLGLGYVENTSDLLVKACEAPTTKTRTFNAPEYQVTTQQLVESMRRVNPKANIIMKDVVSPKGATWGDAQEPAVIATGLQKELGWKPKYSLDEAIRKMFNHFRKDAGMPLL